MIAWKYSTAETSAWWGPKKPPTIEQIGKGLQPLEINALNSAQLRK